MFRYSFLIMLFYGITSLYLLCNDILSLISVSIHVRVVVRTTFIFIYLAITESVDSVVMAQTCHICSNTNGSLENSVYYIGV